MKKLKKPLLFTLIMLPFAVIGSYFAALYTLNYTNPELLEKALAQIGSKDVLVLISTIQPVILALLCSFFGYILSEKVGLMRSFSFERKNIIVVLGISALCGIMLSLDAWTFAKWIPELNGYYDTAGSFNTVTWITSVIYGGIIEEVMLRLFVMSLISFIIWKCFFRKEKKASDKVFITANVISALIFAAGHLPSTAILFGNLTPLLLIRCFLLNGAIGTVLGRFYRKYGIQYAMLAHVMVHIVSKIIWIAFIP